MAATSDATIRVIADVSRVAETARIIARHLTALADDLDRLRDRPAVPAGRDVDGGEPVQWFE